MIKIEFDNGSIIHCELILSQGEKILGLRNIDSLPPDHGLWFSYDVSDYYMFWNKDVDFPIDILFMDNMEINTIVSLDADSNKVVMPVAKSDFVLEINRGVAHEMKLKVGSKIIRVNDK
jgi:uncharacterized membrane protein (UPF0127 family)